MLTFSFALRITISTRKVSPQRERKKSALDRDSIAALLIRTGSPMAIPQRRLSAILYADLAGSVRMTERERQIETLESNLLIERSYARKLLLKHRLKYEHFEMIQPTIERG